MNGLYYAILVAIVGAFIVAVGGAGIPTMRRYWERASSSVEMKSNEIKQKADADAARMKAEEMKTSVSLPESDTATETRPM